MNFYEWCFSAAPHSPRRQKLNLRMKSLSLDSPESTESAQRRRHAAQPTCIDPQSSQSSSSRIQCNISQYSLLVVVHQSVLKHHHSCHIGNILRGPVRMHCATHNSQELLVSNLSRRTGRGFPQPLFGNFETVPSKMTVTFCFKFFPCTLTLYSLSRWQSIFR